MEDITAIINEQNNSFLGCTNTDELFCCVKSVLPFQTCKCKIANVCGTSEQFKATVMCDLNSPDAVCNFVEKYGNINNETLRIMKRKEVSSYLS